MYCNKNILILGFGRIGKTLAKRCLGFDSKVYVHDPFIDAAIIKENNCFPINFKEGLKIADFVSVNIPLNQKTRNMIAKDQLTIMKKTCILVNTARGGIINEQDLIWALTNKEIYGAGIDVYEKEPIESNDPLLDLSNVVLAPHIGSGTITSRTKMAELAVNNLIYIFNK